MSGSECFLKGTIMGHNRYVIVYIYIPNAPM